ncbi:GIY-YIG nuclease family protein [Shimia thalassica]|uniref:GIY-YIG nuclease family protein n=1 Tax=Shimia thalassica TaxID=1715693 RepID=UPI0026E41BA3|nr:GIY-YIG nuclease family protein [Shimia thalassica]MDO6480568.1 GIY-YIG nuclease family protein [Shimia thalassica]
MADFSFNDLLERRDVDLGSSRLVRHDWRALEAWRYSRPRFEHFVSFQKFGNSSPYRGAKIAFQFLPMGGSNSLFVGAHKILDEWESPPELRQPKLYDPTSKYEKDDTLHFRYDLERLETLEDLVGRVVIDWGAGTRAWSQWAARREKPILEMRATQQDDAFPGFSALSSTIEEVSLLPQGWQGALASVRGVYLLVCPKTGEQYVGSAYGEDGFMGRGLSYAANGHGGNRLLITRRPVNYLVSILEIASPDMSTSDIVHRETAWKTKLGSKAHGLNAN